MHTLCMHFVTVFVADFSDEMPLGDLRTLGVPANIPGVLLS